jgi:tetratricopeptide (TPR) repeat protein
MTQAIDRLNLSEPDAAQEYPALVRALRRKKGFGLFFVQASPAKGQEILTDLRKDLAEKRVAEVTIGRTDDRLFEQLEAVCEQGRVDIFWVEGLDQSLLGYEDMQRLAGWDVQDLMTYSWKDVPPILSHLNLGRERFEARFDCAVVFVVPLFVVKYLLRRAGDFFDWKSGFFEFPDDRQALAQQVIEDANYYEYLKLDDAKRLEKILRIKDLLDTPGLGVNERALLLREMGQLFQSGQAYEQAMISYELTIQLKSDFHEVWYSKGNVLRKLGRYESAITAYRKAIELNPQDAASYNNLGITYRDPEDNNQAIKAYQRAIALDPEHAIAYCNLGNQYADQKNYEQAIIAFQHAIKLEPNFTKAFGSRGEVYRVMKHYDEALEDYNQAIQFDPTAWRLRSRGQIYQALKLYEDSLSDFDQVIELDPEDDWTYYYRALTHLKLNQPETAETDFQKAISISTSKYEKDQIDYQNTFNLALYHLAAAHPEESDRLYTSNLTAPIEWLQMAIDDLNDFLHLFPEHSQAQQVKQLLQGAIQP